MASSTGRRGGDDGRDLDLLVLGDVNPDILVPGADPRFGQEEVLVDSVRLAIGGSAGIMASAAARLGLRVAIVGVVGDDVFGRFMLDELRRLGVDAGGCRVDPSRPTGATVILARPTDRAILTATGTIADLTVDDVPDDLLARSRHVHVASLFLQPALQAGLARLLDRGHRAGATVSVDPNWDPSGEWDGGLVAALPLLDVFLPNAAEASRIARELDVRAAARWLRGDGEGRRPVVVVKRGADGAFGLDAAGAAAEVRAFPVDPVDTTGAGDAFDAGFLAAWLDGRSIREAMTFAAACGALSTRALGGTAGQPTRREVESALATRAETTS
jgi:sugar/nucleoside kinase (ribokinase family)